MHTTFWNGNETVSIWSMRSISLYCNDLSLANCIFKFQLFVFWPCTFVSLKTRWATLCNNGYSRRRLNTCCRQFLFYKVTKRFFAPVLRHFELKCFQELENHSFRSVIILCLSEKLCIILLKLLLLWESADNVFGQIYIYDIRKTIIQKIKWYVVEIFKDSYWTNAFRFAIIQNLFLFKNDKSFSHFQKYKIIKRVVFNLHFVILGRPCMSMDWTNRKTLVFYVLYSVFGQFLLVFNVFLLFLVILLWANLI